MNTWSDPSASVIIITRNRPEMVRGCLEHLQQQTFIGAEIIVVDSSTQPSTKELIESQYPQVKYTYLPNGKNRMQVSRNCGIEQSSGDMICFLDDDSMAAPHWLEEIVKSYTDERIGAVGGLVEDIHGPVEQPAGGKLIGRVLLNGERVTNYHLNPGQTIPVDLVRGCNMSFRRDVLRKLGGFDPAYTGTNIFEAGDYCLSVRNAGYQVLFNPSAKVVHMLALREDIPIELSDLRERFYKARNWTLWVGKNLTWKRDYLQHLWLRQTAAAFQMEGITFGRKVLLTGANICGKMAGTFAWGRWRLGGEKVPALKWQDRS